MVELLNREVNMSPRHIVERSLLIILFFSLSQVVWGQEKANLHPRNKMLIELNLMGYPKYYPDIPRCTAAEALSLYRSGKALILWIGLSGELVPGGIHLTEKQAWELNPNLLPLKEGRILLLY
jgi:hypothetical protein